MDVLIETILDTEWGGIIAGVLLLIAVIIIFIEQKS